MSAVPLVLVAGSYGYSGSQRDTVAWWYPGSAFWQTAARQGLQPLGAGDPFEWSTAVGGVGLRPLTDWNAAGQALRWFALSYGARELDVIAHSHGGNLAAECARRRFVRGFAIRRLTLVATPIRPDMRPVYEQARAHVQALRLIWTPGDLWQRWGGGAGPLALPDVENIMEPATGYGWARHRELLEPARWTARGWWAWHG